MGNKEKLFSTFIPPRKQVVFFEVLISLSICGAHTSYTAFLKGRGSGRLAVPAHLNIGSSPGDLSNGLRCYRKFIRNAYATHAIT